MPKFRCNTASRKQVIANSAMEDLNKRFKEDKGFKPTTMGAGKNSVVRCTNSLFCGGTGVGKG